MGFCKCPVISPANKANKKEGEAGRGKGEGGGAVGS